MTRDPFFNQIRDALSRKLDPDMFERCAPDLMQRAGWQCVPVAGGDDLGMDGAIADSKGEAFPLVVTTAGNAIGNLTRNLESYRSNGGRRQEAIFVTSNLLTSRRRRNLEDKARELGFSLIQVFDQEAVAALLYRDPKWCNDLLGLTGDPPALSIVPRSLRPQNDTALIGREEETAWLERADHDCLVAGHPGSGKTYLLQQYARGNDGLFVNDTDLGRIANDLRELEPHFLIVDDAHTKKDLVVGLRQLRTEIGAEFRLVATCWNGARDEAQTFMGGLPDSQVLDLKLLTRDQIVNVVKGVGISGPTRLIRELVDQAEGRPGLAITLAQMCWRGDTKKVVLGNALARVVRTTFGSLLNDEQINVLAGFSIAGDAGMSLESVARFFKLPELEVQGIVTNLASGGIVHEVAGANRLTVRPTTLRHAFVRDVFFCGARSVSYGGLARNIPVFIDYTKTLIGATAIGATINDSDLLEVLELTSARECWLGYAWLGKTESENVLRLHPELVMEVASPTLEFAPEAAIPLLMQVAVGDDRPMNSALDHGLRKLEDWAKSPRETGLSCLEKRRALITCALGWLSNGQDERTGLRALAIAFDPILSSYESDPGCGNTVTLTRGPMRLELLRELAGLWPQVQDFLSSHSVNHWAPMFEVITSWASPNCGPGPLPDDHCEFLREHAGAMLMDLAACANGHQGAIYEAIRIGDKLGIQFDTELDGEFATIYPPGQSLAEEEVVQKLCERARALAAKWARNNPEAIAARLASYENQVSDIAYVWPDLLPDFCAVLAREVDDPTKWCRELLRIRCGSRIVCPFLSRLLDDGSDGALEIVQNAFDREDLAVAAAFAVVQAQSVPGDLLRCAMGHLHGRSQNLECLCRQNRIPEPQLQILLHHDDASIRVAVACAMYEADPRGEVPESLRDSWREALLQSVGREHHLGKILAENPEIAIQWVLRRVENEAEPEILPEKLAQKAVSALSLEDRITAIRSISPRSNAKRRLIPHLVGLDSKAYEELLDRPELKGLHLLPLNSFNVLALPDWARLAAIASRHGYDPQSIAKTAIFEEGVVVRKSSDRYEKFVERFKELESHNDDDVRSVGRAGVRIASDLLKRERDEEHREAVYGWH